MKTARLDGVDLEYDVVGSGEPVLLIGTGPIADSFLPFLSEKALIGRYRLILYRQRGQARSGRAPEPVSFVEHAADAAALLAHLGVRRAHVAGHSTGAAIALQLALDQPELVHSMALLEPPLTGAASAGAFFEKAGPALAAYGAGDREGGMASFLALVSGLDWESCRTLIEKHVPGGVAQAVEDADGFFGSYLPALGDWQFGSAQAAALSLPVCSVVGTKTDRWFVDGHDLLHSWFPRLEDCAIDGVGHLLHMERPGPVARGVAEFFARRPLGDVDVRRAGGRGAVRLA